MKRVLIAAAVCALASWPAYAQRSDTGPANQRSDTGPANQRSDTGPANQRSDTGPANQRSDTGPANQRSDTGPANQRSDTGPANQRSDTGPANQRSDTGPANQRSDTGPANQRSDTGPANQRSDTGPANQRSDTGPANQRSDTGPANQRSDTGPANQRSSATAWQDLTKMPPKELDPAKFQNKALRDPKNLKTNQFTVEYVPPTDKKHTKIYDVARQRQLLEKVQAFLSPLYLPNPVKLQIKGCDGVVNAHFWQNVISVCYEYFDWILQNTPKDKRAGVSPHDAMIGPTVDVFLHEAGHAIFQLLDIPLLGSEEDGADYIATFLTLQFPEDDARRLIVGSTLVFGADAQKEQGRAPALADYADRHSLPAKRYFNRLCMAYGKDPKLYADAIARGKLTKSRASHCSYEYAYISDAFRRLIGPYIDQDLAKEVKARQWFQFDSKSNETMASAPAAR